MNPEVGVRYYYQESKAATLGLLDVSIRDSLFRVGFGDYSGSFRLLHLQQAIQFTDFLATRFGVIQSNPGLGLDLKLHPAFLLSLDVFNINDVEFDIRSHLLLTEQIKLSLGLAQNPEDGIYNNYTLGVVVQP